MTNMRIYWDQVLVDSSGGEFPTVLTRIEPAVANLHWRGFSAESTPDGREPYGYDYARVSAVSPWKQLIGSYTREGDVRPLLREVDDLFVVSRPGDEIALSFDASALPPLARRHTSHVPVVCRWLQQGNGHQLGEPRQRRAAAVPWHDEISVRPE